MMREIKKPRFKYNRKFIEYDDHELEFINIGGVWHLNSVTHFVENEDLRKCPLERSASLIKSIMEKFRLVPYKFYLWGRCYYS